MPAAWGEATKAHSNNVQQHRQQQQQRNRARERVRNAKSCRFLCSHPRCACRPLKSRDTAKRQSCLNSGTKTKSGGFYVLSSGCMAGLAATCARHCRVGGYQEMLPKAEAVPDNVIKTSARLINRWPARLSSVNLTPSLCNAPAQHADLLRRTVRQN